MKQTLELAQRRCGASSNTPTGQHLTSSEVDSVCLVLLALHSALQQVKLDVEAASHAEDCEGNPDLGYCINCELPGTPSCPLATDKCPRYALAPCNCWKATTLAKIGAALEGK